MIGKPRMRSAHVGDWIEARGRYGRPARRGQIVELLAGARHERYRVRWDEQHESILYPLMECSRSRAGDEPRITPDTGA